MYQPMPVNIGNISCIGNIGPYIGSYYRVNIVLSTSKPNIVLLIYIGIFWSLKPWVYDVLSASIFCYIELQGPTVYNIKFSINFQLFPLLYLFFPRPLCSFRLVMPCVSLSSIYKGRRILQLFYTVTLWVEDISFEEVPLTLQAEINIAEQVNIAKNNKMTIKILYEVEFEIFAAD